MVKVHFVNGDVREFDYDWMQLAPKLQHVGIRLWRPEASILIPVVPCNIQFFEYVEDEEDLFAEEEAKVDETPEPETVEVAEEVVEDKPERKESAQERADKALEKMKELSECTHEEHLIYYQESLVGKARKPVKRYFPVCKKCGVREKFIKSDLLPDEVKEAAKLWDK